MLLAGMVPSHNDDQTSGVEPIGVRRYVAHSFKVSSIAQDYGWLPGARYTNLRDVKRFERLGFLDINWKNYNFKKHLSAARSTRPRVTVARDIDNISEINQTLDEALALKEFADDVAIVPKDIRLTDCLDEILPKELILGYSVPTRYGMTTIPTDVFKRPVHLLGGRPDVQRRLADSMNVVSLDCNRFTLDAAFGDYFDGQAFRPHPTGGYERCIRHSLININRLWAGL